jgi:hypothetical protein
MLNVKVESSIILAPGDGTKVLGGQLVQSPDAVRHSVSSEHSVHLFGSLAEQV